MADQLLDKDTLSRLTDAELFKACKRNGINAGPVTSTTRSIYEKRLRKVLEAQGNSGGVTAASSKSTNASTELDKTQLEQQRESESLAKIKLEQTRLAKVAAERELEVQRELELRRELERQRELDRENEKAFERERQRERERELNAQKEREREREKAAEIERERLKAAEKERELQRELERIEQQRRLELTEKREREMQRDRERREREAAERQAERDRVEKLEQQRRMETAAAKARQQSAQQMTSSAIPVRVNEPMPSALNKENVLYPSLSHLDRPATTQPSSRFQFKQPFSDATSGYGLQNNAVSSRRVVDPKGMKTGSELESELSYPSSTNSNMKDGLGRLGTRDIDLASVVGQPKYRSSICPSAVAAPTVANATVSNLAVPSTNTAQSIISPIRDKWADRLSQHGILRDANNTLYTTTIASPSGIRGRPPMHTEKPQLATAGSVTSTTSNDLYNQKPDFGVKKMSDSQKSASTSNKSFLGGLCNVNLTYVLICLIVTIVVYLFFMQIQPNPSNPVDL